MVAGNGTNKERQILAAQMSNLQTTMENIESFVRSALNTNSLGNHAQNTTTMSPMNSPKPRSRNAFLGTPSFTVSPPTRNDAGNDDKMAYLHIKKNAHLPLSKYLDFKKMGIPEPVIKKRMGIDGNDLHCSILNMTVGQFQEYVRENAAPAETEEKARPTTPTSLFSQIASNGTNGLKKSSVAPRSAPRSPPRSPMMAMLMKSPMYKAKQKARKEKARKEKARKEKNKSANDKESPSEESDEDYDD